MPLSGSLQAKISEVGRVCAGEEIHHTTVQAPTEGERVFPGDASDLVPAEVAMSASDQRVNGRWQRTSPTIQIEGGSYSLDAARRLRAAVGALLDVAAGEATT